MLLEVYQLPETVEVLGTTFLLNSATLFALFMPILFGLFLIVYLRNYQPPPLARSGNWIAYGTTLKETDPRSIAWLLVDWIKLSRETGSISMPSYTEESAYQSAPQLAQRAVGAGLLYVSGGKDLPSVIPLYANRSTNVGRSSNLCHQPIRDSRISRLHATFSSSSDRYFFLEDQGSAGGTYLNGRRLDLAEKVLLKDDDMISFNNITYCFQLTTH